MADSGAAGPAPGAARVVLRLMARPAHFLDVKGTPRGGRALALLAYLLVERPSGASRDELMEILWDPVPGADASARLRTQLYDLNRHLPPGVVERTGRLVAVNPDRLDCDLLALREAIGRDDPRAVLDLYQADVFDEALPRHAQYLEEWADDLRRRTQRTVREFLARAAERGLALDPALYVDVARKLVLIDEEALDGWTQLVRAGLLAGEPAVALEAADQIDRLLRDTEESPDPKLRELLARARGEMGTLDGANERPLSGFIGRKEQLTHLRKQLWAINQGDAGGSAALAGPSGIGKTRLLDEVARIARGEGIRVLRARAFETEWRTPNSILPSLMGPLLTNDLCASLRPGEISALRPIMPGIEGQAAENDSERVGFRESVLAVLRAEVSQNPVLLIVDDAHFSDAASLEVLHRIAQEARKEPLLLLLAFRDAHQRVVDPLLASAGTLVLRLSPFSREEAGKALDSMARFDEPAARERLITALLAASGGVPLVFLQQLVLLRREGLVRIEGGRWAAQKLLESERIGHAAEPVVTLILRRLEGLGDLTRQVLAAAAVLHHPATIPEIAEVAGLDPVLLPGEVDTLVRERLLELQDAAVVPAHAEIGEAALRGPSSHQIQAMFTVALRREAGEPGSGSPTQTLTRLRLACGAGLWIEAALLLLEEISALPASAESHRKGEEVLETLARVRGWCATPDLYARLHNEVAKHGYSSRARRQRIRELKRRTRFRQTVRDPWAQRILAVGATAAILLPLLVFAARRSPATGGTSLFGGGGTLLLESQGALRGLRIVGAGPGDTLAVPVSREMLRSPDSLPEPGGTRVLHRCVSFKGPPETCMTSGRQEEVIAPSPGDDFPLGWAPDGHAILLMSDRGSESGFRYDIFIHDLDTGTTRNISNDPFLNYHADWSPDGTRIAYTIRAPGGDSLVLVGTDGERMAAWGMGGLISGGVWSLDNVHLAVVETGSDLWTLLVVDAVQGSVVNRFLVPSGSVLPIWSPNGEFVAVDLGTNPPSPLWAHLYPADANSGPPLDHAPGRLRAWVPDSPTPYLDRIAVTGPNHLIVGESQRISLTGEDSEGNPLEPNAIRVKSSRTDLLWAIGGDTVAALGPGEVILEVSAGGWRTTRHTITVAPAMEPRAVLRETWTNGLDPARWRAYGNPAPELVRTETGSV
ncbi:MAG: AAA family ATPase, partial [Gemmatimonadota bacterium]